MADISAGPDAEPATIAMTRQLDICSRQTGRTYRIQIALPLSPAATVDGYPTIYVIDGDIHFAPAQAAARLRSFAGEIEPAVVVGIGYPEAEHNLLAALERRNVDLTPARGIDALKTLVSRQLNGLNADEFGGADSFLEMIETEIKPCVGRFAAVARGRDILFGHSLGGLFTLYALFTRPGTFATYISLSPSIWWDDKAILRFESAFLQGLGDRGIEADIFIGVGEFEQTPEKVPALKAEAVVSAAMVDNAMSAASRLARHTELGGRGRIKGLIFEGDSHASALSSAMRTVLDFALPPKRP